MGSHPNIFIEHLHSILSAVVSIRCSITLQENLSTLNYLFIMMKLILSLTLIWVLSSTARALQCMTCTDERCSAQIPLGCSSETMCVTASIKATTSGTTAEQIFKACAPSSLCPSTGSQTFSASLGVTAAVASAKCCNTDNCNTETLPFPAAQVDNSLQCFVCNPMTSQCTSTLTCRGVEDKCFQASVTSGSSTSPAFGCASSNICAVAPVLGSFSFMQSFGTITSGPTCCGSSLCNSAVIPPTTTLAPTTTTVTTTTPAVTTTTAASTTTTSAATTTTDAPTTTVATTTPAATTTTDAPTTTTVATTTPAATTTVATTTPAATTTTAAPTTTVATTAPAATTTTAAPTTTTVATTTPAATTTTDAPSTTTPAATTTTAGATTTVAPSTSTSAPTSAISSLTTTATAVPTTTTTTSVSTSSSATQATTTTTSDACSIRLGMVPLLLGLLIFTLC